MNTSRFFGRIALFGILAATLLVPSVASLSTSPSKAHADSLPVLQITGVTSEPHSVVIHYEPIAGAADYRVFDVANPHTVKYAGKVHYDVNCIGTPQVPTCGGQNHFVVDSSGHLVYPYQVSATGTGPQVVNTINDEIQWNFKRLSGAHILVVQAVNELGPVPPGSLYNSDNQPRYPAMAGMLGSNEGPTPDGNVSINGQGPATDNPQPIAQSQPIVVSPTNAPVLPSASNASQVFFDSFTNAEGATFRRVAYRAQVPSGTSDNMEYTLNAGTPQAWTLQYLGADTTDSQPMIDRNHFMDILFDAGTPNISSPLHIAHGVMAMSPDQTADFSGGRVLHVTMEVDAHFSGRRWVGINLAPATDPLVNWYTNGGHINTSDQAVFLQFFPGTCDLSIFTGPTSATNPNPTGIDLWGSGLTTPVYCTYARQTIDYGGNGLGLDDRSRFDLFISTTHVALFENGLLLAQSTIPGGLPFTQAKVYFTHYVYHTANDVLDLQNSAPWETYWLHSFPYSDERHWDNLGFEVLPDTVLQTPDNFASLRSFLHIPSP